MFEASTSQAGLQCSNSGGCLAIPACTPSNMQVASTSSFYWRVEVRHGDIPLEMIGWKASPARQRGQVTQAWPGQLWAKQRLPMPPQTIHCVYTATSCPGHANAATWAAYAQPACIPLTLQVASAFPGVGTAAYMSPGMEQVSSALHRDLSLHHDCLCCTGQVQMGLVSGAAAHVKRAAGSSVHVRVGVKV
jgi:hypothetical protein